MHKEVDGSLRRLTAAGLVLCDRISDVRVYDPGMQEWFWKPTRWFHPHLQHCTAKGTPQVQEHRL